MNIAHPKVQLILEMKNQMKSGFQAARKMVATEVDAMKAKVRSFKTAAADGMRDAMSAIPGVGDFAGVAGTGRAALIAGGITLVTAAGIKATQMAARWDESMAKVNVTAQLQRKELKELSGELKTIAGRNHGVFEDVPQAFNSIVSAGLSVNKSMALLEPTLQAAKAGFTDVETVAKAAVSTMASSGIEDATRLYDILFATLNKGNAEFTDIATYLPKIIPMARNAGISLEEVAGSFAYLTAQGHRAEAAATGMQNVFKSFSDGRTLKGFKAIGVELFDSEGRMRGLMKIVADLKKSMDGLTDKQRLLKFDAIGLDQEAASTLSSMIQEYDKLDETIKFVTKSQGEFDNAIDNSITKMDEWKQVTNSLSEGMTTLGESILPVVKGIGALLKLNMDWWAQGGFTDFTSMLVGDFSRPGRQEYEAELQRERDKKYAANRQEVWSPYMNAAEDKQIKDFVEKRYASKFFTEPGKYSATELQENSLVEMKRLADYKSTLERAIDSDSKKVKGILQGSNVKDMNDFYRMMNEGTIKGLVDKLGPALPKTTASPFVPADKEKAPKGSGSGGGLSGGHGKQTIINIEEFIGGDIVSQNKAIQNMSADELKRFMAEAMVRMVAGVETSSI